LSNVVIRAYGQYYDVSTPGGILRCVVRGSLKRERRKTDLVAVGDRVEVRQVAPGEGVIEAVLPRQRVLSRRARGAGEAEHVIVANPDQLVAVLAVAQPEPSLPMLDRFLVIAEAQEIPALVCVNKIDLDPDGTRCRLFDPYRRAGYPVVETSALTGAGLHTLWNSLAGKLSALAGPSGVGKSSLVKAFRPDLEIRIGELSEATGRGRHTTTVTSLIQLDVHTFIADTPGLGTVELWGVKAEGLDRSFPEFRRYLGACYYADCRHLAEPGCAVREAVEAGALDGGRYASYRILLEQLLEEERVDGWRRSRR
jgi:ribosome biogenesis GTPase